MKLTVENNKHIELFEQGEALLANNKLDEAIVAYTKATRLRPQFWLAFYQLGKALLRQEKYLESANAFFMSCLHGHYKTESVLLCARALHFANFTTEASMMFDRLPSDKLDADSAFYYSEVLLKEGRSRQALLLLDSFDNKLDPESVDRLKGALFTHLGDVNEAEKYLEKAILNDHNGFVYDNMIHILYAKGNFNKLLELLKQAEKKFSTEYYKAQKISIEYILGMRTSCDFAFKRDEHKSICDSAVYIKPFIIKGAKLTGTTYQAFEVAKPHIPDSGLILEFGVRNGHTITKLAELFSSRRLYGFDSFIGLPEAWNDEVAGSYSAIGKLPKVPQNVHLIAGWFEKTLPEFKVIHDGPIAFMNVDCDLYSATKTIFDQLDKQIVAGTVIVFDEYIVNASWREDEFKAFQEWVISRRVKYEYIAFSLCQKQAVVKIIERD